MGAAVLHVRQAAFLTVFLFVGPCLSVHETRAQFCLPRFGRFYCLACLVEEVMTHLRVI